MVGNQIKKARLLAGLTQKDLGDKIGKGVSTICEWEGGKRSPDIELLPVLGRILNVNPKYFVEDPEELLLVEEQPRNTDQITDDEMRLVMNYRSAEDWEKKAVRKLLNI